MSFRLILASASLIALAGCGAPDPAEQGSTAQPSQQANVAPAAGGGVLSVEQIETGVIGASAAARSQPTTVTKTAAAPPAGPGQDSAPVQGSATGPDAGMVRLQILLDRSPFSPGVIDGLGGENTRQAVAAWPEANGMQGDTADAAMLERMIATDTGRVMTESVLTPATSPAVSPPAPEELADLARSGVNYTSALERLAERFHMTETLLQGLNPGVDFRSAGARIIVPAVNDRPLANVARIVVNKSERSARAFDASGKLLAFYPATIGSSERPAPSGTVTVTGVAPEPDYTYDPSRVTYDRGDRKIVIPAGPNNPVGTVWIDLSRDTYGIHGSPDPSKIGKTASNGCVRLTNWDAEQLAAGVKPGVEVRFV